MKKEEFDRARDIMENSEYSSLEYTEFCEIEGYEVISGDSDYVVIYGYNPEKCCHEYHFACNTFSELMRHLERRNENEQVTFVPEEWVEDLKAAGFAVNAVWKDYFSEELARYTDNAPAVFLTDAGCTAASEVARACAKQSRGFYGQSAEWFSKWIAGKEPAVPDYVFDSRVIVEMDRDMKGLVCVGLYGKSETPILWVKEIAVRPEHQGKGVAKKLMGQAFAYGAARHAKKAFLHVDECNEAALHIYEGMGFKPGSGEGQIDMARN